MSALRQTLAQSLCFLVLLSIGGMALESFLTRELQAEIDQELQRQFADLTQIIEEEGSFPEQQPDQEILGQIEQGYGYITEAGRISGPVLAQAFYGTGLRTVLDEDLFSAETVEALDAALEASESFEDDGTDPGFEIPFDGDFDVEWRVLAGPVKGGQLIVFMPAFGSFGALLPTVILIAVILLSIPALAVGIFFGWRAQKRLDRIARGYARIADGDLSVRMAPAVIRDDLDLLAARIDESTGRLQGSMRQMSEFSANIAHDLRTPLTRLQLHLGSGGYPDQAFVDTAIEQTDRIIKIFDAIQRIARLRTRERRAKFKRLNLGMVAEQAVEIYRAVAEDEGRQLTCKLQMPADIDGDAELLLQMLANLVENAIRHTAAADSIELCVDGSVLSVTDSGPGIPEDQRQKVLEPLYRLDRSRTSDGSGLGLAMVKAISDLHDADLELSEPMSGTGLRVTVRFMKIADL